MSPTDEEIIASVRRRRNEYWNDPDRSKVWEAVWEAVWAAIREDIRYVAD
jgi:hypothetical protein